jgi:hypothetical protein
MMRTVNPTRNVSKKIPSEIQPQIMQADTHGHTDLEWIPFFFNLRQVHLVRLTLSLLTLTLPIAMQETRIFRARDRTCAARFSCIVGRRCGDVLRCLGDDLSRERAEGPAATLFSLVKAALLVQTVISDWYKPSFPVLYHQALGTSLSVPQPSTTVAEGRGRSQLILCSRSRSLLAASTLGCVADRGGWG